MLVRVDGKLPDGVTAKDIILAIIGEIGTAGGTGYVIEYAGEAIRALSMEGRMTVCNMSIEGGARAGLIAADETTYAYLKGKPQCAEGRGLGRGAEVLEDAASPTRAPISTASWCSTPTTCRRSSPGARRPRTSSRSPASCPNPDEIQDENKRISKWRALDYMGLKPGTKITDIRARPASSSAPAPTGRIEDLRDVASVDRRARPWPIARQRP